MNIVHQLRSGGDGDFADVYGEVPWLEFVPRPDSDRDAIAASFDAMAAEPRRAFKTHSAPGELPYQPSGGGPDVKYIVVMRNPDEALASLRPFIASHSDAWFELWGAPRDALVGPDLATFFGGIGGGMLAGTFGFVDAWWPLRHEPNVLFVHYADMKADPEGSVRRIADFLGFDVADDRWATVLEHTSFAWMKAHEDKFELRSVSEIPILDPGAMMRKGQVGAARDDGVTPEMSAAIAEIGRQIVADPQALAWAYGGGPLTS
jgi:aryl sulfotransferase